MPAASATASWSTNSGSTRPPSSWASSARAVDISSSTSARGSGSSSEDGHDSHGSRSRLWPGSGHRKYTVSPAMIVSLTSSRSRVSRRQRSALTAPSPVNRRPPSSHSAMVASKPWNRNRKLRARAMAARVAARARPASGSPRASTRPRSPPSPPRVPAHTTASAATTTAAAASTAPRCLAVPNTAGERSPHRPALEVVPVVAGGVGVGADRVDRPHRLALRRGQLRPAAGGVAAAVDLAEQRVDAQRLRLGHVHAARPGVLELADDVAGGAVDLDHPAPAPDFDGHAPLVLVVGAGRLADPLLVVQPMQLGLVHHQPHVGQDAGTALVGVGVDPAVGGDDVTDDRRLRPAD